MVLFKMLRALDTGVVDFRAKKCGTPDAKTTLMSLFMVLLIING
jgi:hypothetical protein